MSEFIDTVTSLLPEAGLVYCPSHRGWADSVRIEESWHEPFEGGTDISVRFDWRGSSRLAVVALTENEVADLPYPDGWADYINKTVWGEVEFCVGLLSRRLEDRPQ